MIHVLVQLRPGTGDPVLKKLLVPVTAEAVPMKSLARASSISRRFGSDVIILYIKDPRTREIMDQASRYALPVYDREYVSEGLTSGVEERAKEVALSKARAPFETSDMSPKEVTVEGEYIKEIQRLAERENMDLIFFDYSKEVLTTYRILEMPAVSDVWLDRGRPLDEILVLASTLAPNPKGPRYAADLARLYGSAVTFCYVVDPSKKVESMDILAIGKKHIKAFRAKNPEIEVDSEIREGPIEHVLPMVVDQFDPGLVIMPRFKKVRKRLFGLVSEDIKTELAKMLETNFLVVL